MLKATDKSILSKERRKTMKVDYTGMTKAGEATVRMAIYAAQMYYHLTYQMVQDYGEEAATKTIKKAMHEFGVERGKNIRAEVDEKVWSRLFRILTNAMICQLTMVGLLIVIGRTFQITILERINVGMPTFGWKETGIKLVDFIAKLMMQFEKVLAKI